MIDETLPDVVKNFLKGGGQLEEIRLSADGKWTHEGLDFENQKIIDLFFRNVGRTEGGTWLLEIGRFTYPIIVDECGYFVRQIDLEARKMLLTDDTWEPMVIGSIRYDGDAGLYTPIKNASFDARFLKGAYLKFADALEFDGEHYLFDGERISA